jgi:arginyl-tRNA synthetase
MGRSNPPTGTPPTCTRSSPVIRDTLVESLRDALVALDVSPVPETIGLERPARAEHGDWSSNIALVVAKAAGRKPRELATLLAEHLTSTPPPHVDAVEIAGPGFVNFRLRPTWLHEVLGEVVAAGPEGYARPDIGGGRTVDVEFVSANPTGPLHAGHARGAVYGDSLARVLERTGHVVTREFYLNDRGVQMQTFGESLAARRDGVDPPEGGYQGQYIVDWAAEMPTDADPLEWGYARALADQREVLEALGVHFDEWFSERSLVATGAIDATLDDLRGHGVVDEADGAIWQRSTDFGDDQDRVLLKSDGTYPYLTPDIAYHRDKFARGFDLLIDVWGADHHGYVARMRAALQALGHDPSSFEVAITQLVKLERDGAEVKISKRTGDIIELRDLIDELGADAVRITYLLQGIDTRQTVDLDAAVAKSMDNPVFYVQYAHARIHQIVAKAGAQGVTRGPLADADLSLLVHERELDVLRALAELPEVIALAATERAPHKVVTWVRAAAGAFHGFYHDCYVLGDGVSPELTQARLWLVEAARIGVLIGLGTVGVSAPESM